MVVEREKFTVKTCLKQVKQMLVALQPLEPSTKRMQDELGRAEFDLQMAKGRLDTLYRHYCHVRHPKTPPKEGDRDLP